MTCPTCYAEPDRSETMIRGHVVLRCKACEVQWIEGDHVKFNSYSVRTVDLQRRANELDEDRIRQEIINSPIDDPRWEQVFVDGS